MSDAFIGAFSGSIAFWVMLFFGLIVLGFLNDLMRRVTKDMDKWLVLFMNNKDTKDE